MRGQQDCTDRAVATSIVRRPDLLPSRRGWSMTFMSIFFSQDSRQRHRCVWVVAKTSGKAEGGTVSVRERQRTGLLPPTHPPAGPRPSLLHVPRQTWGAFGGHLAQTPPPNASLATQNTAPLVCVLSLYARGCLASPQRGLAGGRLTAVNSRQACH